MGILTPDPAIAFSTQIQIENLYFESIQGSHFNWSPAEGEFFSDPWNALAVYKYKLMN